MLVLNGNVSVIVATNLIKILNGLGQKSAMKDVAETRIKIVAEEMQSVFGKFPRKTLTVNAF